MSDKLAMYPPSHRIESMVKSIDDMRFQKLSGLCAIARQRRFEDGFMLLDGTATAVD